MHGDGRAPTSVSTALEAHAAACHELGRLQGERCELAAAEVHARRQAWDRFDETDNITTVKAKVERAAMSLKIEQYKVDGDIAETEAFIRMLETWLVHHREVSSGA